MSDTRQHVHELLDLLPPDRLAAVEGLLKSLLDREEDCEVAQAKQWLRDQGGKGIPPDEILAEFGLTPEDFRRMGEERDQRRR
ncbi:MAG TPA: hypothetical protein VGN17_06315 [Bryobacteraceae bacterium]|jgi:hypothetical protein